MRSGGISDHILDSKEHCFFCLDKIVKVKAEAGSGPPPIQLFSLQYLSRYLKLDMTKVLNEDRGLPPEVLAKLGKSRLKVQLCAECAHFNEKTSELCRQLEKLKMEVKYSLKHIHGKLSTAEESTKIKKLRESIDNSNSSRPGFLEVLEGVRAETIKKCTQKLKSGRPRVKLENWRQKTIRGSVIKKEPTTNRTTDTDVEQNFDDYFEAGTVKMEVGSQNAEWSRDESYLSNNNIDLHDEEIDSDVEDASEGTEGSQAQVDGNSGITSGKKSRPKVLSNDRYKCCGKQYSGRAGFNRHQVTIHRGVKFACQICKKQFSRKDKVIFHQQMTDCGKKLGLSAAPKHKCHLCGKDFKKKEYLNEHLKRVHLKLEKHTCDLCGKIFGHRCDLNAHRARIHGRKE